ARIRNEEWCQRTHGRVALRRGHAGRRLSKTAAQAAIVEEYERCLGPTRQGREAKHERHHQEIQRRTWLGGGRIGCGMRPRSLQPGKREHDKHAARLLRAESPPGADGRTRPGRAGPDCLLAAWSLGLDWEP